MKKFFSALLAGLMLLQGNTSAVSDAFNGANTNSFTVRVLKLENNKKVIYVSHDKIQEFLGALNDYIDTSGSIQNFLNHPAVMASLGGIGLISSVALGIGSGRALKNHAEKIPDLSPTLANVGAAATGLSTFLLSVPLAALLAVLPIYCNNQIVSHEPNNSVKCYSSNTVQEFGAPPERRTANTIIEDSYNIAELANQLRLSSDDNTPNKLTDLNAGIIIYISGNVISLFRCATGEEQSNKHPDDSLLAQPGSNLVLKVFESRFTDDHQLTFKTFRDSGRGIRVERILRQRVNQEETTEAIIDDFTANNIDRGLITKIFW